MPKFRTISGQFVGYVPDGPDTNIVPDREPMDGQVVFTPVFTGGVIAFPELVPPEFAHPKPIRAKIIDGFVRVEVAVGDDVFMQPLSLMVTVDDEASQVWSWRAEFTNMRIGNGEVEVQIPAWSFRVPDGSGPVDLTELVPLKSGGTVDVTKGPRGAGLENITAVDGQLVFEYTDGQESTVPIPEAVQGPQGEPGPAGADGEQGPQGEKGDPGEIPDLLVGNITDATPTGKNLMLAATEGAARNALGLAAGATAINGALSELENGVSNNPRVWTPANLANYTAGKAQALVDASKTVVNVKDYGAVGDGVTDDSPAVIAAMGALENSGGTLMFPGGHTYNMVDSVEIFSDVTVSAYGATFVKKAGHNGYSVFVGKSHGNSGYSAGPQRIAFLGGTYRGSFNESALTGISIGLHHAQDVTFRDLKFTESVIGGHCMDLAGCRGVMIDNCVFEGSRPRSGMAYVEAIQIDYSTRIGFNIDTEDSSYDGLPTVDVTVRGCKFVPLTIGDTKYSAPVALGSHSRVEDQWITNINFLDNLIDSGRFTSDLTEGTAGFFHGWIHLFQIKGATIRGNTFISAGDGQGVCVINMRGPGTGTLLEDVAVAGAPAQSITRNNPTDISIEGNTFVGFTAGESTNLINISGYSDSDPANGVRVVNNQFLDSSPAAGESSPFLPAGQVCVALSAVQGGAISGNTFDGVYCAVRLYIVRQLQVTSNTAKNVNGLPVSVDVGRGVVVQGNTIRASGGVWCRSVTDLGVVSNHFWVKGGSTGPSTGTGAVMVNACKNVNLSLNSFSSVDGNTHAVEAATIYGTTLSGVAANNIVTGGFTKAINITANSSTVVETGTITGTA